VNSLVLLQQKEISNKQKELDNLRNEIASLETEIKTAALYEKINYDLIEKFNKQTFLINRLINNYRREVRHKEETISLLQKDILILEEHTRKLKENYAAYVVAVYKGIYKNDLVYLLDAGSIQQIILRYKYLRKFSDDRKKNLETIKDNKERLIGAKHNIEGQKEEQEILISEKEHEEKILKFRLTEKKTLLDKIKNDKNILKKELNAKRKAENEIKNIISRLITKDEERRKEEKQKLETTRNEISDNNFKNKKITENFPQSFYSTKDLKSFVVLRGNLGWPVSGGSIIRKFGENKNEKLNTVTLNYGIDIKVSGDLSIKAVGDGFVSAIEWLPGYGSVIIVTHRDEYRTVYGHLDEIYIKEGDKISAGYVIGKVGESLEGYILHFEIWNHRNFQNPEIWLAKK
jgi:septal ring factor EnvC (AmiA/AmiB activator)